MDSENAGEFPVGRLFPRPSLAQRPRPAAPMQTSARRVYELLRSAIRSGYLPAGEQLVEHELVKALSTSRNALRVALQLLADEGVVERNPRRGTIISSAMIQIKMNELDAHTRVHTAGHMVGLSPTAAFEEQLLDERVLPASPYVKALMAANDEFVRMQEWLISVRGEPNHVWVSYVHPDVDYSHVLPNGNRVDAFRRRFGVEFARAVDVVEAVPCEERTSKLLGVPAGAPILARETLLYGVDGRVRELRFRYNRGDRVSYQVDHYEPTPISALRSGA